MSFFGKIKQALRRILLPVWETRAEKAYDLWASAYDNQPYNLMLELDKELFAHLTNALEITGAQVIDIGCGTGRHWHGLLKRQPARMVGYDVSRGMLAIVKQRFPAQEVYRQTNHLISQPANNFDILISTLTVAHILDINAALREWARVVKPGGSLIITDFHPATLARGGQRTFSHNGKIIAVENYVHPVNSILRTAKVLGLEAIEVLERNIDESMRGWYEKQNAMPVYEKFKGAPVIYGLLLKKSNVLN